MVMHMKKLCVGISTIEQLIASNERRAEPDHPKTGEDFIYITTRSRPQQWQAMCEGGSLYWIIDRRLCCRQEIIDFREGTKQDGTPAWHIELKAEVIPVEISRHKPFQGWRYLDPKQAPADLSRHFAAANPLDDEIPHALRRELTNLGLL
jgi:hypothetical protein